MHLGVNPGHLFIELGMFTCQDLRVPSHRNKYGVDAARQRCREHIANLETDEERKCHDHRRVSARCVVRGFLDVEEQVSEKCAGISNKDTTKREDRTNQAFLATNVSLFLYPWLALSHWIPRNLHQACTHIDERINSAVLDHVPGILGGGNIRLPIQSDVAERISVQELSSPFQHRDEAAEDAEHHIAYHAPNATLLRCFAACN